MKYTVKIGGAFLLAALTATVSPTAMLAAAHAARSTPQRIPGYLGVGFQDANGHGVEILVVDHDGPAGKFLRPHDLVLSMNGQPIPNSDAFSRMIHESAPGVTTVLLVQRDGRPIKMTLQITDRSTVEHTASVRVAAEMSSSGQYDPPVTEYSEDALDLPPTTKAPGGKNSQSIIGQVLHLTPFTGLALQTMEPQLADFFGASQGVGLLVQQVAPNSPAAFCGLRAGDVILRADAMPIKTASDWGKHLRANQGQPIVLNILREHRELAITLTPEAKKHSTVEWPQLFK